MKTQSTLPCIIQGGMGVNISTWQLARAVSMAGQRGTVSGVALDRILARILQRGDPCGHMRRALSHFPFQDVADKVIEKYFVEGGIPSAAHFAAVPKFTVDPAELLVSLTVCANFAFVWLAKEGHSNPVSINYLEKIALPHVYAITGALMAGVDIITMGAGLPFKVPELIDNLVAGRTATYTVPVSGTKVKSVDVGFNPEIFFGRKLPALKRPEFIPIIASNLLANIFMKKLPQGSVQGFVIEEPSAGGHNAPPRKPVYNERHEPLPVYGEKDEVDYDAIAELGVPFWIGGGYASPEKLKWAISVGAQGIQAGSIFALCEESGLDPVLRRKIRERTFKGEINVRTDMRFSPTGFPFKIVEHEGTLSEEAVYRNRTRVCDHGALAHLYEKPDGSIGYRCGAEPTSFHLHKGGAEADTVDRGCLCSGLIAAAGFGDLGEPAVVTLGDDVAFTSHLMKKPTDSYTAADALKYLLN